MKGALKARLKTGLCKNWYMNKIWFITGTSRGFGRAYAEEALARGDKVIAAARIINIGEDAFWSDPNVYPLALDVTDSERVKAAVNEAVEHFGRIDILVNNAGYGFTGALEECSEKELRALFDTCFFGLANVTKAIIPVMRRQMSGRIINIASRSGMIGEAGITPYNAVKFAVVGLSEGLNEELSDFNIQVMVVCPGAFRTDFRDCSSKREPANIMSEYDGKLGHRAMIGTRAGNHKQQGDPRKAAKLVYEIAVSEKMPVKLMLGKDCCDDVIAKMRRDIDEIAHYYESSSDTRFDA